MNLHIVSTTDGRFLGHEFQDIFPLVLGAYQFIPDDPPMPIGGGLWRFSNSNYSIDAKEV